MALNLEQVQVGMLNWESVQCPKVDLRTKAILAASKFLSQAGFGSLEEVSTLITSVLSRFSGSELLEFAVRSEQKVDWGLRTKHPVMEALCDQLIPLLFSRNSQIIGVDNLNISAGTPVIFLGNHQSAIDVHLLHNVLKRSGRADLASNLSAVVGYKTFEYGFLRQMSLCFNTLKVPQSLDVSDRSRELGAREVAKQSARVIDLATKELSSGHSLVVFPEGTRTRTGELLPMLPAISRYIRNLDNAVIIPWSIQGADKMVPVDTYEIKPADLTITFGKAILAKDLKALSCGPNSSKVMMDVIGFLIAAQLPEGKRGFYRSSGIDDSLKKAHQIATAISTSS